MSHALHTFFESFPSASQLIFCGPVALIWAWACLSFAGSLKQKRGFKTGYTRKVFHVLIFSTAVCLQLCLGLSYVFVFGLATSVVIVYALVRGPGNLLFEAIARETDAPHRTHFILVSYLATLIGGTLSSLFFGPYAVIGYLVAGFGDAAGEPVGTRWGRHVYTTPGFGNTQNIRSIEGSIGVFAFSIAALLIALAILPNFHFSTRTILFVPLVAAISAAVEAISPHGWDNAPMQILPTFVVFLILQN